LPVTIREVARHAGVAVGTVSRVVNNLPDVNPELRKRVQSALDELKYRPNARARSLARNSSPTLSFILGNRDFLHPFHSHVLQGVEEYCEESGYFVIYTRFRYSPTTRASELRLPTVLQSHGIADCVILAGTNYDNFTSSLEKRGIHYVLLVNNFVTKRRREAYDQVRFDDYAGAVEATNYLVQLGHKHIWYIGDTSVPWYRSRYEAFAKTMLEAGLQPKAQTLALSDDRFLNGLNSMRMILEQKATVTAILTGSDDVAYGAWEALRLQGLEVPRDISLIGFDDQHPQSRVPALTSVRVEAAEVGRQLAKMAITKISLKGQRSPEVLLGAKLIKRETCRPLLTQLKTRPR
jgi:DNA-binding LacI/PurR family transcriptional regulator